MTNREFLKQFSFAIAYLAISTLILVLLYANFLPGFDERFVSSASGSSAKPLLITGAQFQARLSGGSVFEGKNLVVTKLKNGEAILAKNTRFNAEDYAFARFSSRGLHPGLKLYLFWQTVERPDGVFYAQIPLVPGGSGWFNLKRENLWQGTIRKIEIGVFGDLRKEQFSLQSLELHPYAAKGLMGTIETEWREFRPWTHVSINAYVGVGPGALISPVVFASIWLVVSLVLAGGTPWLLNALNMTELAAKVPQARPMFSTLAMICWLALTLIWLTNFTLHNKETRRLFSGKSINERKLADWDGANYYRFAMAVKEAGPSVGGNLAILVAQDGTQTDMAYRLRYHLFPELKADSVALAERENIEQTIETHQYILVFGSSNTSKANIVETMKLVSDDLSKNTSILYEDPLGMLLNVQNIDAPDAPIAGSINTPSARSDR